MLDAVLMAAYVLACLLIAVGIGVIYWPAGLIAGGALLLATVVRVARAPAPEPAATATNGPGSA
jgi:hypothetical protein